MQADFKIVYVAPMKALAAEVTANFQKRLEPLGERALHALCAACFVCFACVAFQLQAGIVRKGNLPPLPALTRLLQGRGCRG